MYNLVMSRVGKGRYTIVDHNDDRLRMVALLLMNGRVRKELAAWFSQLLYEGQELSAKLTNPTIDVVLRIAEGNIVMLQMHEEGTAEWLQTDISRSVMQDLIDAYEALMIKDVQQMRLSREADNFLLEEIA